MLVYIFTFFITNVISHVFMAYPPSRRNKYSEYYFKNDLVDYNLMAPLNTPGYSFPCKGYLNGPATAIINSDNINVQLEGSVFHNGGHCQFGVSYDDSTFVVLKTIQTNCLTGTGLNINVPLTNVSGNVTFFWTWINSIGNREYYMECADIFVNQPFQENIYGKELLVVNLPNYTIIPEFPLLTSYNGIDLLNNRNDIIWNRNLTTILTSTSTISCN
jgi:hypothetical protein